MKNIFKFLFLVAIICGVTSCKDFLTPEPTSQLTTECFYSTDDEVEAALTAVYVTIRNAAHGTTYTSAFNGFSDEDIHYNAGEDRVDCYSVLSTNSTVQNFWTQMYTGLKNIAYLLEGIEKNKSNLSERVYKNAKGEALFLRGYFHFMLAQWFCHPDTGIPMYLHTVDSYEGATNMSVSKLHEFYIQIEKDMKEAEALLVSTGQTWKSLGYSERVTVSTVRGLLARVALHAAGMPNEGGYRYGGPTGTMNSKSEAQAYYYKLALECTENIINTGEHELTPTYKEAFIAPTQDLYVSENIWEIGYHYTGTSGAETNIGGNIGNFFGIGRQCDDLETATDINDSLLVSTYRYMHPRLYASYGIGDDRRDWNYANFYYENNTLKKIPKEIYESVYTLSVPNGGMGGSASSSTLQPKYSLPVNLMWGIPPGKWRREYEARIVRDGNSTTTNMPLLRYADVLLMAAESIIELNDMGDNIDNAGQARTMDDAVGYINKVRQRAIPSKYESQSWVVTHIVMDENNRGYVEVPEIEVEGGSGSGFEIFTGTDLWSSSHGRLRIGIADMGTGYSTPPTITVKGSRTITWRANTDYQIGDYVSAPTTGSTTQFRLYRASSTGNSGDTAPTHSSGSVQPGTSTVMWLHISGAYNVASVAPKVRAIVGQTGIRSVGTDLELVNPADADAMRNFLRDERRRELCFENLRRQDLKRWGILYSTMSTMSNDYYGETPGVIPFGSGGSGGDQLTTASSFITEYTANYLPIPQSQLVLNRNLQQNPGY